MNKLELQNEIDHQAELNTEMYSKIHCAAIPSPELVAWRAGQKKMQKLRKEYCSIKKLNPHVSSYNPPEAAEREITCGTYEKIMKRQDREIFARMSSRYDMERDV